MSSKSKLYFKQMNMSKCSQTCTISIYVSWHFSHPHVLLVWPRCRKWAKATLPLYRVNCPTEEFWLTPLLGSSQRLRVPLSRSFCLVWEIELVVFKLRMQRIIWDAHCEMQTVHNVFYPWPWATRSILLQSLLYIVCWEPLQDPDSQTTLEYGGENTRK